MSVSNCQVSVSGNEVSVLDTDAETPSLMESLSAGNMPTNNSGVNIGACISFNLSQRENTDCIGILEASGNLGQLPC